MLRSSAVSLFPSVLLVDRSCLQGPPWGPGRRPWSRRWWLWVSFWSPLAPPLLRFSPFGKTHFFERKIDRRLDLKKLDFCIPWKGPKTRFVTKRYVKLQFPLWRLGPKRALCKSTWAAEGPPKGPFLAPWTVPIPIPFCTGFSFAAVILPGPLFQFKLPPESPDLAKCILFI